MYAGKLFEFSKKLNCYGNSYGMVALLFPRFRWKALTDPAGKLLKLRNSWSSVKFLFGTFKAPGKTTEFCVFDSLKTTISTWLQGSFRNVEF